MRTTTIEQQEKPPYGIGTRAVHAAHEQLTELERERAGVTPELVRLSVGIEDPEDLVADLDHTLSVATGL